MESSERKLFAVIFLAIGFFVGCFAMTINQHFRDPPCFKVECPCGRHYRLVAPDEGQK